MSWSNFQAEASSPEEEQAESEGGEENSSLQDEDWPLEYTLSEAGSDVHSVAYSPDGEYIAYASSDDNVYIHDTETYDRRHTLSQAGSDVHSVAYSPDGEYIAYASSDDNVYIHDTETYDHSHTLSQAVDDVNSVTYSPDGEFIAYASSDDNVYIHDTETYDHSHTLSQAVDDVNSVTYSPDGEFIAYGAGSEDNEDNNVYIHDTETYDHSHTLSEAGWTVRSVAYSPDGKYIAYASWDYHVYIHDTETYDHSHTLSEEAEKWVLSVAYSSDGKYIAYGSSDDNVYVHNTEAYDHRHTLSQAGGSVFSVAYSPDGAYIAYASSDDNVYVHSTPPEQVVLSHPVDDAENVALQPELVWEDTDGAESYELVVSENDDLSEPVIEATGIEKTSYEVEAELDHNVTYYWQVRAINEGGEGEWSDAWSFATIPEVAEQVVLSHPVDDAENVALQPELVWEDTDGAESYELVVSENDDLSEPVIEATGIEEISYEVEAELDHNVTYYWQVRAINEGGEGEWSQMWNFTTIIEINPFTLHAPEDGLVIDVEGQPEDELEFIWDTASSQSEEDITYTWMFDADGEFEDSMLEYESNNDGADSTLTFTYEQMDKKLSEHGLSEGESLQGEWLVEATVEGINRYSENANSITLRRGTVTNTGEKEEIPEEFALDNNYPNPFNPITRISYQLPEQASVTLEVYNILSQHVKTLVNETQGAGNYEVSFDGSDISSGTYIYRLEAGDYVESRQMMLVK